MSVILDRMKALGVATLFVANLFLFALLPDLDIRLLGIEAHRNFLFHGALPVLVLWIGRQWIALRPRAPGRPAPDLKGLDLLVCPAAMGLAFHLFVEAFAPGGSVVRFPFRGSLVAAATWDDRAWLAINGLISAAIAWRTWTPAFALDFRGAATGVLALGRLAVARAPRDPNAIENPTEADAAARITRAMEQVRDEEVEAVGPEGATAREIRAKLAQRVLHVCLVGRVSTGKTALAKALVGEGGAEGVAATAGTTRAVGERLWEIDAGEYKLRVLDTPGLEEIDGEGVAAIAR
ncbi:MAG: GTPase domain-containing protein, partial [Myxococcales bacterium]|nr:GTPase domain-containing protein [Myxococcales bacterium]